MGGMSRRPAVSFESSSIAPFLREAGHLKKAKGKLVLAKEEKAYGAAFSADLGTLIRLQEKHALPTVGAWSFFRGTRSLAAGKGPVLTDRRELLWPLCALYPIAQHGSDMALATMRPPGDPRSWIYLFEGEESESIQRTHFSIAQFIWTHALVSEEVDDTLFGDHDEASDAFTKDQSRWTVEPLEDPLVLFERSRWLLRALMEKGDFALHTKSRRVPGLAEWEEESSALAEAPHLALYWLLAHWISGNTEPLAETLKLTQPMRNLDVQAVRRYVDGRRRTGFATEVREQLPARMRTKKEAPVHLTSPKLLVPSDEGLLAALDDIRGQQKLLKQMATNADAKFKGWVETHSVFASGADSHGPEAVAVQKKWADAIDERMLIPTVSLVRRSFKYPDQLDERALFWIISALGRLGPSSRHRELVLKTLLAAPTKDLYDDRFTEVVRAIAKFDDARVEPWLEKVVKWSRKTKFMEQQKVFEAALDALAVRNPRGASAVIVELLAKSDRSSAWLHAEAARVAADRRLSATYSALAKAFPRSIESRQATIGRALATIDPKKARPIFLHALEQATKESVDPSSVVEVTLDDRTFHVSKPALSTLLSGLRLLSGNAPALEALAAKLRRSNEYWAKYVDA